MKVNQKSKTRTVTVKVNEDNPEPLEILAKSIIDLSEQFEKIQNSKVSRRAIVLLLHSSMPSSVRVSIKDIETILEYAPKLKNFYLKPEKK